ncbi:MAG: bifunctional diguanylate cyclase/phosphodiesterase [Candidatus Sedimenticola sp. 20ELBAFRAG]
MSRKLPADSPKQSRRDKALEKQNRRYAGLLDSILFFDQKLKTAGSLEELTEVLREQVELVAPYRIFALLLVQEDASFELQATDYNRGADTDRLEQLLDKLIDDGIFARAVRVRRPLLARGASVETLLSAVVVDDEVKGMLLLHGNLGPDTRTMRVLQHVIERSATALARLHNPNIPTETEEHIYNRASFDTLTGLLSRQEWMSRVSRILDQKHESRYFAVGVLINLDGFWRLNQHFGDRLGSGIVKFVATRLRNALHSQQVYDWLGVDEPSISIARTGRDEFAIFISRIDRTGGIDQAISYLRKHLSEGFVFDNNSIYITASIGISLYPMDAADASTLIRHADIALKHAKQTGRDKYVYYSEEMQQINVIGLGLEQALHRSLREGLFFFHYQPQVDVASGHICATEALLRMKGDDGGLISPAVFIPLAEHIGLAHKIGEWGLRVVCRQIKAWQQEGYRTVPVAVNVSAQQLNHPELVETYTGIITEEGISPDNIELEITETAISHDKEQAVKNIKALHNAGFRLVLDDFGAGYSTLAFLSQFPVDGIKIDKMFIDDMSTSRRCSGIIISLIDMASRLGISIIAEGVEEAEQLQWLDNVGCPLAQGYLIARPMPAGELARNFLKK